MNDKWSPESWQSKPAKHLPIYKDKDKLALTIKQLSKFVALGFCPLPPPKLSCLRRASSQMSSFDIKRSSLGVCVLTESAYFLSQLLLRFQRSGQLTPPLVVEDLKTRGGLTQGTLLMM